MPVVWFLSIAWFEKKTPHVLAVKNLGLNAIRFMVEIVVCVCFCVLYVKALKEKKAEKACVFMPPHSGFWLFFGFFSLQICHPFGIIN